MKNKFINMFVTYFYNDSKLIIMDSELGHLCFNEIETISDDLSEFMGEFDDC